MLAKRPGEEITGEEDLITNAKPVIYCSGFIASRARVNFKRGL